MHSYQAHGVRPLRGMLPIVASLLIFSGGQSPLIGQPTSQTDSAPPEFVEIRQIIPDILVELRYHGANNFTGAPVPGYTKEKCWMTRRAAAQLAKVQADLRPFGLGLKIFDAYRPKKAVAHFVDWVADNRPDKNKAEYFPNIEKRQLIKQGYISDKSGHSRGSSIDLTLVEISNDEKAPPIELDMGTPFDFFGHESWTADSNHTLEQRKNRLLLKAVMERRGFVNYSKEWWHFRLADEPFPKTYFDFSTGAEAAKGNSQVE